MGAVILANASSDSRTGWIFVRLVFMLDRKAEFLENCTETCYIGHFALGAADLRNPAKMRGRRGDLQEKFEKRAEV